MANDTITLALDGDVSLDDFAKAMQNFMRLANALTRTAGDRKSVEWVVDQLDRSSAVVTVRGESRSVSAVEHIAEAYLTVGRSLSEGNRIPFPKKVREPAERLAELLDDRLPSIRFETLEAEVSIRSERNTTGTDRVSEFIHGVGAVEGMVQALSSRRGLRFTLYDTINDKAISCYLDEGRESIMRDAWGRRALVEGLVTRDPDSGRAVSVSSDTWC